MTVTVPGTAPASLAGSAPPLALRGLSVAYAEAPAVWDVSFEVPAASLTAIIGPNGAGKSTLLKAALGLVPRLAGEALFFGAPLSRVRRRVAYVPQRTSVDWDFPASALDVVTMGLYGRLGWLRRPGRRERAQALACLERVGMADFAGRQISELSGGQQQRVFLARALAQEADLTFMDEPFAGVDAVTERTIVDVLHGLRGQGRSVVVVHHDLDTVREYFDRVALLNVSLVAAGPTGTAFSPAHLRAAYGERHGALAAALAGGPP
ncbi:metal ABC transporter ATP-binding protein [Deinococcus sp. MIMF12]|uniref:Metal ABC transporter ATP-binding protein n=1 Tax=Deinococcus rhizophilus TaxID=3049544 RepID=A0ABT7JIZ1_9DEIO|nr:metal ABC transporter ATP-binding protein [Deinococcus rhizophilus]MDL2344450.1 metal ABC transporter ATP-binding protein [Deinococcus rhizophilus]